MPYINKNPAEGPAELRWASRYASMLSVRVVVVALLLGGVCSPAERVPKFDDFATKALFHGSPAQPRFTNDKDLLPDSDDRYRESVEIDARRGPNFAGRYTIAGWSCGVGCSSMVVIDARTGTIYRDAPFGTLDIGGYPGPENHEYAGLSFRKDSSLLMVEGCFDADFREANGERPDCNRSYYQWVAPRFKLLRKIPLPPSLGRK